MQDIPPGDDPQAIERNIVLVAHLISGPHLEFRLVDSFEPGIGVTFGRRCLQVCAYRSDSRDLPEPFGQEADMIDRITPSSPQCDDLVFCKAKVFVLDEADLIADDDSADDKDKGNSKLKDYQRFPKPTAFVSPLIADAF